MTAPPPCRRCGRTMVGSHRDPADVCPDCYIAESPTLRILLGKSVGKSGPPEPVRHP